MESLELVQSCSKCKLVKSFDEFSNQSSLPTGKKHQCKDCDREYRLQYYADHRDKLLAQTAEYAKIHSDAARKYKQKYASAHVEERRESRKVENLTPESRERKTATARKFKKDNPVHTLFMQTRSRAKQSGIPFSLEESDLEIPDVCPVLGIPLLWTEKSRSGNTPSVDRMVPELGYIPENVAVISWRANRLKNDGTAPELHLIANWMDKQLVSSI
jgi:hypothetical protein